MKSITCVTAFAFALAATLPYVSAAPQPQLVSVKKIWDAGKHNAFTDLIRFGGEWLCTFREGDDHVGGDGKIRILASRNGDEWKSVALISEPGIDLRDPKLSVTPSNELHLVMGGSIYAGKTFKGCQPRVAFSKDARTWSTPQRVLASGDWLWRVTWHEGRAYGISYVAASNPSRTNEYWTANFVTSDDGRDFRLASKLNVPGRPNEGIVRFLQNGDAVALLRREAQDKEAWIGLSRAPFTNWTWRSAGMQIGGPNFIELPEHSLVASGRRYNAPPFGPKMFVGSMTKEAVTAQLTLPSGGDCSYAGMVWHDELLWVSYYSSHEGKTSIYLAKVSL